MPLVRLLHVGVEGLDAVRDLAHARRGTPAASSPRRLACPMASEARLRSRLELLGLVTAAARRSAQARERDLAPRGASARSTPSGVAGSA